MSLVLTGNVVAFRLLGLVNLRLQAINAQASSFRCRIPDDCIDPKRYPLFMAREVMLELLAQFKAESKVNAKVST